MFLIKIKGDKINAEIKSKKPPTLKYLRHIKKLTNHKVIIKQV